MIILDREFALCWQSELGFDECHDFLRRTLSQDGFRIIAEIPFDREFERHVRLSWPRYTVFIVWNDFLAHQALLSDRDAGIFMPFHVVVGESSYATFIAVTNYALFGRILGTSGPQLLARDLWRRMRDIFAQLAEREKAGGNATAEPKGMMRGADSRLDFVGRRT